MKSGWFFHDVIEGLRGAPLRSGLILFSVSTGVFALTLLFAILAGLQERARELQRQIGARELWVQASRNGNAFLTESDLSSLQALFPGSRISGYRNGSRVQAPGGLQVIPVGGQATLGAIRGWTLQSGRFLDPWDLRHDPNAVVVGPGLAQKLNLLPGTRLVLGQQTVTVVGITQRPLQFPQSTSQGLERIWVPSQSPLVQQGANPWFDGVLLEPPEGRDPEAVASRLVQDWARSWPEEEWQVLTADRLLEGSRRLSRTVRWVYGSVSILCLILGGVTLASLLTLGVRQRKREIGLRLSIGATKPDICGQFLAEGLLMTLLSAAVGILTAGFLVRTRGPSDSLPMIWVLQTWLPSLGTVLLLGLVCSLWPSLLAARTDPAEAMRAD